MLLSTSAKSRVANFREPLSEVDWTNRRVVIMGLGRHGGGVGAARFLSRQGARVTICDMSDRDALTESIAALADVSIAGWRFGSHVADDLEGAEFVVVNPAVRLDHPLLRELRDRGTRLISEIELCLALVPAKTIAVTGTSGKSTTATMLAQILRAAGQRVWLGGNIGGSLLDSLPLIAAQDWAILELSSFQLAHLSREARFPALAAITNCTPHHLDWHGGFAAYAAAKQRLLAEGPASGMVVLNAAEPALADWARAAIGRVRASWSLEKIPPLLVPGEHNRQNAACAAAVAESAGVDATTICTALARFPGLDHRLQFLGQYADRRFYNDSKATSPAATRAAIRAVRGPLWILAGGADKGADFNDLARGLADRVCGVALFGAARERLHECLRATTTSLPIHVCEPMSEALDWCIDQSQVGDAILLSPACASHDQYPDFAARGAAFKELVLKVT